MSKSDAIVCTRGTRGYWYEYWYAVLVHGEHNITVARTVAFTADTAVTQLFPPPSQHVTVPRVFCLKSKNGTHLFTAKVGP